MTLIRVRSLNYLTPRSGQVSSTFHNNHMTWLIHPSILPFFILAWFIPISPFHNLSFHIYFVLFMIGPQGLNMPVYWIWTLKLDRSLIIVFPLPQVCTLVFVVFVPVFPNTIRCLGCVNYWRSFPSKDCFKLWTHSKWDSNLSEWN